MSEGFRVLVTCDLGAEALERFHSRPEFAVEVTDIRDEASLLRALPGFQALVVRSNVRVTEKALTAGGELRVVGRAGIGVDNIDLAAATRLGIAVVNAPGGNVVTTAEHAVALLLSLARKIPQATASMKALHWEKKRFLGREVRGKALGIIGIGRVGSVVAELAMGLKMRVLAFDPYLSEERAARLGAEKVHLDRLLSEADFITVHTPLTADTRGIIGRTALQKVKPGVLIVNCARGGIVDEEALLEALEQGRVAGAALDVFETEPPPPSPLHQREDVILTPHLGASTAEAQAGVAVEVAENVIAFLVSGTAPNTVNTPAISPDTLRTLGPHLDLSERMGLFLAQITPGPVLELRVASHGDTAEQGSDLVTASVLKGLLTPALSTRVNLVNAPTAARERGIRIVTSTSPDSQDFSDLVSVEVRGAWGSHMLEGTLFGKREPRLVRFDAYRLDAVPRGNLILIYNEDVPGVIGAIGTCLGQRGVNIAGMYNGRVEAGGQAINLVNVDGAVPEVVLRDLSELPHIRSACAILL